MLKKYSTSRVASSIKSVQWTAFLPLSFPYTALNDFGRTVRAISGSCGPHNYLKLVTTLSCLTYIAMQGPFVIYSTSWLYSGTTFLYTYKNSFIIPLFTYVEGLSSQNISIALTSNPAPRTESITWPTYPSLMMWGLITKQEQLLKHAGELIPLLFPKKN